MIPVPALHISDYTETKIIFLLSILAEASCTEILKKKKILLKITQLFEGPRMPKAYIIAPSLSIGLGHI